MFTDGCRTGRRSSDAATTLHALNVIWKLNYTVHQLAEIGLTLGADVPVFVHGFSAFAEGIGEQLFPLQLAQPWYLVLTPHVHVSTAEIFGDLELTRDCPTIKICGLPESSWDNVCLPVVVKHYPEVGEALEKLDKFASARMSGTGASVFVAFDSQLEAIAAQQQLRASGLPDKWKDFIAQGLNESPLLRLLYG